MVNCALKRCAVHLSFIYSHWLVNRNHKTIHCILRVALLCESRAIITADKQCIDILKDSVRRVYLLVGPLLFFHLQGSFKDNTAHSLSGKNDSRAIKYFHSTRQIRLRPSNYMKGETAMAGCCRLGASNVWASNLLGSAGPCRVELSVDGLAGR